MLNFKVISVYIHMHIIYQIKVVLLISHAHTVKLFYIDFNTCMRIPSSVMKSKGVPN